MAAVTICSDFEAEKNSLTLFPLFPHQSAMKWWDQMPWFVFWMYAPYDILLHLKKKKKKTDVIKVYTAMWKEFMALNYTVKNGYNG